ncbi:MAG: hypothetical protein WC044_14895 [Crocinitomicaceae bacterium]
MSSSTIFYAIADFMGKYGFMPYEWDWFKMIFNYGAIVLGFIGLFYWLNLQMKMTKKAKEEGRLF